jgi:uncharacterized phage-associated protein
MHFPLKVEKTIQAIGVLFRADGVQRMNYMRLLKLLYIADREAFQETERSIIGGPVVAMERGPVLSEVYDLIRGQHTQMPLWDRFLRKDRYELVRVEDPDVKKLSRYEIQKLQNVAGRHAEEDEFDLSHRTHGFAEWAKNRPPAGSSRRIPLEDILEAIGLAAAVPRITEELQHLASVEHDLGGHGG